MKVSYILCNHQSVGYILMLCIQFHWQFLIISSDFWLVNILLRKFDTSSEKEMKMIITQIFWWKTIKKCHKSICKHKVASFTLNLPHCPVMQHAPNFRNAKKYRWKEIVSGPHSMIALNIEVYFFLTSQQMQRRIQDPIKYLRRSFLRI